MLSGADKTNLRKVAALLLPGDHSSPAAESLDDLDALIDAAVVAVAPEEASLARALAALPADLTWESLEAFSIDDTEGFEIISAVAAGAYFMSPEVLTSIGYPIGGRKAPRNDLIVDELETGVLDDMMARPSMVRKVTA